MDTNTRMVTPTFVGSHLDLSFTYAGHANFAHSDLTITVAGGATFTLPTLDSTGMDLGTVTVRGEVGKLLVGDSNLSTPALKKLDIDEFGITNQDAERGARLDRHAQCDGRRWPAP